MLNKNEKILSEADVDVVITEEVIALNDKKETVVYSFSLNEVSEDFEGNSPSSNILSLYRRINYTDLKKGPCYHGEVYSNMCWNYKKSLKDIFLKSKSYLEEQKELLASKEFNREFKKILSTESITLFIRNSLIDEIEKIKVSENIMSLYFKMKDPKKSFGIKYNSVLSKVSITEFANKRFKLSEEFKRVGERKKKRLGKKEIGFFRVESSLRDSFHITNIMWNDGASYTPAKDFEVSGFSNILAKMSNFYKINRNTYINKNNMLLIDKITPTPYDSSLFTVYFGKENSKKYRRHVNMEKSELISYLKTAKENSENFDTFILEKAMKGSYIPEEILELASKE